MEDVHSRWFAFQKRLTCSVNLIDQLINLTDEIFRRVNVAHEGECLPEQVVTTKPTCQCNNVFNPVCGSDGKTYTNYCKAKCRLGRAFTLYSRWNSMPIECLLLLVDASDCLHTQYKTFEMFTTTYRIMHYVSIENLRNNLLYVRNWIFPQTLWFCVSAQMPLPANKLRFEFLQITSRQ